MARGPESVFRHHWRAFFSGGLLSLTRLITGFVRIKYVALMLGTAGVGFLSQANELQILGISIASLSMAVGVINRMGAIGPDNRARERRLLSTAFTAQIAVSIVLLTVAVIFARPLTRALFGADALSHSPISALDVLAVVFSVPLSVVASGYLEAVFFGAGRYDLYVRASVWATVLGFLSTLTIIAIWKLPGTFWSIFASSALLFAAFFTFVRRIRPVGHLFRLGFDPVEGRALLRFSIAMLVSSAFVPTARLWVKSAVIGSYGIDALGLLQVPLAITAYYTPFLTSALWGRMHPTVTRVGASPEGRRELTVSLRLTVCMATAAIVSILFLKDILVPMAYSRAFLPATHLLPVELFGDYCYFVALPFTVYALGLSRLRIYLAAWLSYSAIGGIVSIVLLPKVGLVAVPLGYGLSAVLGAIASLAWLISRGDDDLLPTLGIVFGGLILVGTQSVLAWYGRYVVIQGAIFAITSASAALFLWRSRAEAAASPQAPGETA
jgi:polysaccharide transporter, PST family